MHTRHPALYVYRFEPYAHHYAHGLSTHFIYYRFSLKKIGNISIENSDKFSVLLLSLKNFNIILFKIIFARG